MLKISYMAMLFLSLLVFYHIVSGCNSMAANGQPDNGNLVIKIFFSKPGITHGLQQDPLFPNTRILYYKNYLIEIASKVENQMLNNNHRQVFYTDTSYYFINAATGQCDHYMAFAKNAPKINQLNWKDKKDGLTAWAEEPELKAFGLNDQTIFYDTVVDNKKLKFFTTKEANVKATLYFTKDIAGPELPAIKPYDKKRYGFYMGCDIINVSSGEAMSTKVDIIPNGLTKKEIDVFEAWIKNSSTPPSPYKGMDKAQMDSLHRKKAKVYAKQIDSLIAAGASDSILWEETKKNHRH